MTCSAVLNILEAWFYSSALWVEDRLASIANGLVVGWIVPSLARFALALLTQKATGVDLRRARLICLIPKLGSYLAVPAEAPYLVAGRGEQIWHFTLRQQVARLAKLWRPWGGWGTGLEARLRSKLAPLLKRL